MSGLYYEFQIPDPTRPLKRSIMGPSGELVDFKPSIVTAEMIVGQTIILDGGISLVGMLEA